MGITVRWDDVMDRVVLMTFRGAWSWDEYRAAANEMQAMIDTVNGRVDRIQDVLSNVLVLPPAFALKAEELEAQLDKRLELTVVVGNDMNHDVLDSLAANNRFIQAHFRFVSSLAEARRLIAESRGQGGPPPDGNHRNGTSH